MPIGGGEPLVPVLEGPRPMEAVVETFSFWPWIHDVIEGATGVGFHLTTDTLPSRISADQASLGRRDAVLSSGS